MTWAETVVRVRVPATSANLGPGFDALGLALTLHDEVEVRVISGGLTLDVTGEGAPDVADAGEKHLVVRSMRATFDELGTAQPPGLALRCVNRIPHGRGLGSSAAAIVAGVLAARALAGASTSPDEALPLASELEGHPDNVAPCLYGGLTIAWLTDSPRFPHPAASAERAPTAGTGAGAGGSKEGAPYGGDLRAARAATAEAGHYGGRPPPAAASDERAPVADAGRRDGMPPRAARSEERAPTAGPDGARSKGGAPYGGGVRAAQRAPASEHERGPGEPQGPERSERVLQAQPGGTAGTGAGAGGSKGGEAPLGYRAIRLEPLPAIRPVAIIAPEPVSTELARGLLPAHVPHADAARSAGRCALLVAALTARPEALLDATADWLHQDYRAPAMPATHDLVQRLRAAGIPAVVSGAGPSVLAFPAVGKPDRGTLGSTVRETGIGWLVSPLDVDRQGASVTLIEPGLIDGMVTTR